MHMHNVSLFTVNNVLQLCCFRTLLRLIPKPEMRLYRLATELHSGKTFPVSETSRCYFGRVLNFTFEIDKLTTELHGLLFAEPALTCHGCF
jgi:hypothetical protein